MQYRAIMTYNSDVHGNRIATQIQNETYNVYSNKIVLNQLPSPFYGIEISGMVEKKWMYGAIGPGEFYTDYSKGIIYFNAVLEGVTVTVDEYWGIGFTSYPIDRIYTRASGDNILETLKDIVDSGQFTGGEGDMVGDVYDPNSINGNVFNMGNMLESSTEKILTAQERIDISTNSSKVSFSEAPEDDKYYTRRNGLWTEMLAGGDPGMPTSTYDPDGIVGNTFDMDNMIEGSTNKLFTLAEKVAIASNSAKPSFVEAPINNRQYVRRNASWLEIEGGDYDGMMASTYDPNGFAVDSFDMDNMIESATRKIMSNEEQNKLARITTIADIDLDSVQADILALQAGGGEEGETITDEERASLVAVEQAIIDSKHSTVLSQDYAALVARLESIEQSVINAVTMSNTRIDDLYYKGHILTLDDNKIMYVGENPPESAELGDIWIDTTKELL